MWEFKNNKNITETTKKICCIHGLVVITDNWIFNWFSKSPNECPRYDTKQFDGETLVMLELWGMQSTLLLPLLPGQLWPGVVAPEIAYLWVK